MTIIELLRPFHRNNFSDNNDLLLFRKKLNSKRSIGCVEFNRSLIHRISTTSVLVPIYISNRLATLEKRSASFWFEQPAASMNLTSTLLLVLFVS
jgi:hypothetical protein